MRRHGGRRRGFRGGMRAAAAVPASVEAAEPRTLLSGGPFTAADAYTLAAGETLRTGDAAAEVTLTRADGTVAFSAPTSAVAYVLPGGTLQVDAVGPGASWVRVEVRHADDAARAGRVRNDVAKDHSAARPVSSSAATDVSVAVRDAEGKPVDWDASDAEVTFRGGRTAGDGLMGQVFVEVRTAGGLFTARLNNDVLANDGGGLTARPGQGPANGRLDLRADGSFDYTPDEGFVGTDTFTYFAEGGGGEAAETSVEVRVGAPKLRAYGGTLVLAEDMPRRFPGTALAANVPAAASYRRVVSAPEHGRVVFHGNGSATFIPQADFFGTDHFEYVVGDGVGESAPARVRVVVRPRLDAPAVYAEVGGRLLRAEGGRLPEIPVDERAPAGTVVARVWAESADPQPLWLRLDAASAGRGFRLDPETGELRLTRPRGGFTGRAAGDLSRLRLRLAQQGRPDAALRLDVRTRDVYDAPTAGAATLNLPEDSPRAFPAARLPATSDTGTKTLRITRQPENAAVTVTEGGAVRVVPDADFYGADSFEYVVDDGQGQSDPAVVTINVLPRRDDARIYLESGGGVADITRGAAPTIEVDERTPAGTLLGRVWAESADPQPLSLAMLGTRGSRMVDFDAETGELRLSRDAELRNARAELERSPLRFRLLQPGHAAVSRPALLQVNNVDDPPEVSGPAEVVVGQGETVSAAFRVRSPDGHPVRHSVPGGLGGVHVSGTGGEVRLEAYSYAEPGTYDVQLLSRAGDAETRTDLRVVVEDRDFQVRAGGGDAGMPIAVISEDTFGGGYVRSTGVSFFERDGQRVRVSLDDPTGVFELSVDYEDSSRTAGTASIRPTGRDAAVGLPPLSEVTLRFADGTSPPREVRIPVLSELAAAHVLEEDYLEVHPEAPAGFALPIEYGGFYHREADWSVAGGTGAGYFEYDPHYRVVRLARPLPAGEEEFSLVLEDRNFEPRDGRDRSRHLLAPLQITVSEYARETTQVPFGAVVETRENRRVSFTAADLGAVSVGTDPSEFRLDEFGAEGGDLRRAEDGTYTFTPRRNAFGTFAVRGGDGRPRLFVHVRPTSTAPLALAPEGGIEAAADAPAGTPLALLDLYDPDFQTVTAEITGGNDDGLIAMDPATGVLSLTRRIDADLTRTIEVTAADEGGRTSVTDVDVTLLAGEAADFAVPNYASTLYVEKAEVVRAYQGEVVFRVTVPLDFDETRIDFASLRLGKRGSEDTLVKDDAGRAAYEVGTSDALPFEKTLTFTALIEGFTEAYGGSYLEMTGRTSDGFRFFAGYEG